jgi:hypothetical protein
LAIATGASPGIPTLETILVIGHDAFHSQFLKLQLFDRHAFNSSIFESNRFFDVGCFLCTRSCRPSGSTPGPSIIGRIRTPTIIVATATAITTTMGVTALDTVEMTRLCDQALYFQFCESQLLDCHDPILLDVCEKHSFSCVLHVLGSAAFPGALSGVGCEKPMMAFTMNG